MLEDSESPKSGKLGKGPDAAAAEAAEAAGVVVLVLAPPLLLLGCLLK